MASRPLADNSFFTHLATGRLLVDGEFPRSNPFLWTGTKFPMPSWWWSGVLGLVDKVAGGAGIRVLAGLLAFVLGALLVRLTRRVGPDAARPAGDVAVDGDRTLLAVVAPPALTLFALYPYLNARPQIVGFVLLAVTVLVWRDRLSPWWLLPVFVTWVNVHGTWLYGVLVLGLLVVAEAVDTRRLGRRAFELAGAAVGGVALGGLLYPDRFALVLLPTRQFGDAVEREAIRSYQEWAPLRAGDPVGWAFAALVLTAVWGCVRTRRWAMAAVALLLAVMGVTSSRMVPVAVVGLVPFAAMGIDGIGSLKVPTGRAASAVAAVGVAICLVAGVMAVTTDAYSLGTYPVAAVDYLEERGLVADPDVRVVSEDFVGNYLELRFGSRANAYVDDRPDARTLLDYKAMRMMEPDWQQALDRADADVVVFQTDRKFTTAVAQLPEWTVVTTKGSYTVLCRDRVLDRCR